MFRGVLPVALCLVGCFAAKEPASADGGHLEDGTPLDDAATLTADSSRRDAPGPAVDGPPLPAGCNEGELCELQNGFDGPTPGWTESITGGCTVSASDGRLVIKTTAGCVAGTKCEYRSPERRMGTARVVSRTVTLDPEINGDLWFEVVDRSMDGPRLYYRPGVAQAVIVDGGGETDAGTISRGDTATWAISIDAGGFAHFERYNAGTTIWEELGSADAPWSVGERVTMAFGITCRGSSSAIAAEWGPVGGEP